MVFLLLYASITLFFNAWQKRGLKVQEGLTWGLPALADQAMLTLGIQTPGCPSPGCPPAAATAVGQPWQEPGCPAEKHMGRWTPLPIDSIFLQLKRGDKWAGCSCATWQGFGDTGHSWRWTQPHCGCQLLPWDTVTPCHGTGHTGGMRCLREIFLLWQ